MKRLLSVPICLLFLLLPTGAYSRRAPILPTVDYYVNDTAGLLFDEHRDRMMTVSSDLDGQTGAQIVVLAIEGITGGGSPRELAEVIFDDWEIGGRGAGTGILMLMLTQPADCVIHVGEGLRQSLGSSTEALEEALRAAMRAGNSSKAVFEEYKAIALRLYEVHGRTPSEEANAILSATQGGDFTLAPVLVLVVIVLMTGRSMRIARRNQKRSKGPIRKRRRFTKQALDEDALPRPESLRAARSDAELAQYDEPDEIFLAEDDS